MRINAYPAVQTMTAQNVLVLDGPDGTKTINGKDAGIALNGLISPEQHRMIFRGKNLGSAPTPQQLAAILTDLLQIYIWVTTGLTVALRIVLLTLITGQTLVIQHSQNLIW